MKNEKEKIEKEDYKKLSKNGKFIFDSDSLKFMLKNRELDKWEVLAMGYTNLNAIKKGLTPIRCRKFTDQERLDMWPELK